MSCSPPVSQFDLGILGPWLKPQNLAQAVSQIPQLSWVGAFGCVVLGNAMARQ